MSTNNWYSNFSEFHFNDDGSFTCKRPDEFSCLETENLAIALLWESSLDFNVSGEDGCMGNFDMYTSLYNCNNGFQYLIPYSTAEEWKEGKEVTIYGHIPNEEELSDIHRYMEWVEEESEGNFDEEETSNSMKDIIADIKEQEALDKFHGFED